MNAHKLKSAEAVEIGRLIARYKCGDIDAITVAESVQKNIDAIALNAYNAGMTEAAEIVQSERGVGVLHLEQIKKAILSARDKKGGEL